MFITVIERYGSRLADQPYNTPEEAKEAFDKKVAAAEGFGYPMERINGGKTVKVEVNDVTIIFEIL